jgi:hypothetical protein
MFDLAPDVPSAPPLHQSPAFARALDAAGQNYSTLPDGTLVLTRRVGPLKINMVTRAEVPAEHLRDLRGPVLLSPQRLPPPGTLPLLPLVSPAHEAHLSLLPSLESLHAGLHQKWRNRLRHAEKQPLRVTRQNLPDDPRHWLLIADAAQQLARRYRGWPPSLTCAYGRANRGDAKLFTAHFAGKPAAACVILRHGNAASYHIAHSRAAGRMTSAHCLLMWEAITWLKRKGVTRFDLGLIDTEEGAGLARFKLGTGAKVHRLGGTWLYWPPMTRVLRPLARLDRGLMRG